MHSISTPALAHRAQQIGVVDAVMVDDDVYFLQVGNRFIELSENKARNLLQRLITTLEKEVSVLDS